MLAGRDDARDEGDKQDAAVHNLSSVARRFGNFELKVAA
jgi:hypothetical protein